MWLYVKRNGTTGVKHDATNNIYEYLQLGSDYEFTLFIQAKGSNIIKEVDFKTLSNNTNSESINIGASITTNQNLSSIGSNTVIAQSYGLHTSYQIEYTKKMIQENNEPWKSANTQLISAANNALGKNHNAIESLVNYNFYDSTAAEKKIGNTNQKRLYGDANEAYTLALAYKLTGNTSYADKAIYFLNNWAFINKEYRGNGYDQAFGDGETLVAKTWLTSHGYQSYQKYKLPHYYDQSSAELRLVTSANAFLFAALLIKDYSGWSTSEQNKFTQWVTNVYEKQGTSNMLDNDDFIYNNAGAWSVLGKVLIHAWNNDITELQADVTRIKDILNHSLEPFTKGGRNVPHMWPAEVNRGATGMWYTYYSIAPLSAAISILDNHINVNLLYWENTHGSTMKDAVDKFFYYTQNTSKWTTDTGYSLGGNVPKTSNWGGPFFEAMGYLFNKPSFNSWANAGKPYLYTLVAAWHVPTLFQPELNQSSGQEDESNDQSNTSSTSGTFTIDPVAKEFY